MKNTRFGDNRTGVCTNPELSREMMEGMESFPPTSVGTEASIATELADYVETDGGFGTVPRPQVEMPTVDEDSWALFIDKLGERLAFERTGVRLYEGLIVKLDVHGGELPQGPEREDLEHIRDEELEHFHALEAAMLELGADPTAVTPCADAVGVIGSGIGQVINDPRAHLLPSLEAVLVAELADNDGWDTLIELARGVGQAEMAAQFEGFAENERDHLMRVRTWIAAAQGRIPPMGPQ